MPRRPSSVCKSEEVAICTTPCRKRLRQKTTPLKESSFGGAELSRHSPPSFSNDECTTPPLSKKPRLADVEAPLLRNILKFAASALPLASRYPLVGRERECGEFDRFLDSCSQVRTVGQPPFARNLYVSGSPGTGKTCSVRAAVAQLGRRQPDAKVFEVNCMSLSQRTAAGLLLHIGDKIGLRRTGLTGPNLVAAVARGLAMLGGPIVIVVDEVDQLVRGGGALAAGPLPTLFSLTTTECAPPIALLAIANAVDLLDRTLPRAGQGCNTLLFEPYTAPQLKQIWQDKSASAGGTPLGGIALEMAFRRTAKQSGDCRQAISLCEQALFADAKAKEERDMELRAAARDELAVGKATDSLVMSADRPAIAPVAFAQLAPKVAPVNNKKSSSLDPIDMIEELPLGQQILLCALANEATAASRSKDICARYKEYCRLLHQPLELASRAQLNDALTALEQRALISLRASTKAGSAASKFARAGAAAGDCIAELTVSREVVRRKVTEATPVLQRCFQ